MPELRFTTFAAVAAGELSAAERAMRLHEHAGPRLTGRSHGYERPL